MAISRPLNTTNVQEGLEPWTPVQGLEARTSSAKVVSISFYPNHVMIPISSKLAIFQA